MKKLSKLANHYVNEVSMEINDTEEEEKLKEYINVP